jgi:hypothetical protein
MVGGWKKREIFPVPHEGNGSKDSFSLLFAKSRKSSLFSAFLLHILSYGPSLL